MSKAPHAAEGDQTPRKKRKGTSFLGYILIAMLIGGLGGFGVENFGGGKSAIGSVGDTEITVTDYSRELQSQIATLTRQFGMPITPEQARALGIDQQVLQGLVNRTALDNEAARIGLSVGDAVVAADLAAIAAFQGASGSFDREAYRLTLQQNGYSEAEFESGLRRDKARALLQGAVQGGAVAPAALTDTIFAWAAEKRGFSVLRLGESDLPAPLPTPTEAEIQAHYDANIATYTRPEAKRIHYAALLTDTLAPGIEVPEEEVKAAYEARRDEFVIPEKRLVERLVYPTEAEATAARARLDGGESFDTLVAERGLAPEDIDLGDVSKADLGAAGDGVFALTEPGVVGPLPSEFGPALYRMNAILAGQETPYETARPDLVLTLQRDAAARDIGARVDAIDDALAGGASFDDLAREQGMELGFTDYVAGAGDNDPIAAYAAFRDAADKLSEGDFPEAVLLEDGGLVALQFVETVPPAPVPLERIRDKVAEAVRAAALSAALSEKALAIKAAVEGGAALESQGILERTAAMDRQGRLPDAPASLLQAVFQMQPGEMRLIEDTGFAALVRLDSITPADPADAEAAAFRDLIADEARGAISADIFTLYTAALAAEAGINLDQAAISAVNTQLGQ